jgi:hypothetical protein
MAAALFNGSRFMREMHEAEERGEPFLWGNIDNLSERAVEELGIKGAMAERNRISSHVASSGQSPSMPRKIRKEHYTRKIAKYKAHEAERRARWERRHPGAPESNWERREAAHREARQKRRNLRRAATHRKRS